MTNFENETRFANAGDTQELSGAQGLAMFDEVFGIDRERDTEDIKRMMRFVKNNHELSDEFAYERDRKSGALKYSDEQIEAEQWEEDDLNRVIEKLRKERMYEYFENIVDKYEQRSPISDSVVRLDQEAEIADTLRSNKPVLIRGNWRMGKTSMVRSLEAHQFGSENSIFIDVMGENVGKGVSTEDFRKYFGVDAIAEFIAEKELFGSELKDKIKREDEIREQIAESQKTSFEFLNDYLAQRGEKVFLSLDEAIGLVEQPEKLKCLADLKGLSNIQLAVVLHRFASVEDQLKAIFQGFETHFVRPLTLEEVGILVRRPLSGTRVTFTDSAIQKIFEFTGGRPMEINNVCRALMSRFSKHKNQKFTYNGNDIDTLTKKTTWYLEESFSSAIRNYKQVYTRSMNDEERAIIDRLIKDGEVSVSEIEAEKVQPLIDTTFVAKDEDRGTYRVNGELFKQVVLDKDF